MATDYLAHKLLKELKQGQDEAAGILYVNYAKKFYLYARNQRLTHEDAEDVVQKVFYRILECIESYDEVHGSGAGWMWRICTNLTADVLRRKPFQELPDELLSSEDTDPEKSFERYEIGQALTRAWEKVSAEDKEEICRGKGRGPGRKAWHEAVQRLRCIFQAIYKDAQGEE